MDILISEETLTGLGNGFRSSYGTETLYTTDQMIALAAENKVRRLLNEDLEELTLADTQGMTKIRKFQFQALTGLQRIALPETLTHIGCDAFRDCTDLVEIVIPNTVTYTEWSTFQGCTSLQSVTIGNGITVLGSSDFEDCTALTQVNIGSGVTTIGISAFRGCTSLQTLGIPDNVTTINGTAFQNCTALVNLTIGRGVTTIGSESLTVGSTSNKATIEFLSNTPPTIQATTFNASCIEKIVVPVGKSSAYKSATNWAKFANYIKEKV